MADFGGFEIEDDGKKPSSPSAFGGFEIEDGDEGEPGETGSAASAEASTPKSPAPTSVSPALAPEPEAPPAHTWESGDGGEPTLPVGEKNQWGGNLRTEGRKPLIRRDSNGKVNGYSTTTSMFVKHDDGRIAVVPTVVDGVELSTEDAARHYADTGEYWGMADDEEGAKKIANAVHDEHQKAYQEGWNKYIQDHWDDMGDEIRRDPGVRGERARRRRDARLAEELKAWGKDAEAIKGYRERTKTTQVAPELFLTGDVLEDADGNAIKPGDAIAVYHKEGDGPFTGEAGQAARLMEFTGVNDDGKPVFKETEGVSSEGAMVAGKLHVSDEDFDRMMGKGEGKVERSLFEQVRNDALADTGDAYRYTDDARGTFNAFYDYLMPFLGGSAKKEHEERTRILSDIREGRLDGYDGKDEAEKLRDAARKAKLEPWNPLESLHPGESDKDFARRIRQEAEDELKLGAAAKGRAEQARQQTEATVGDKILKGGVESGAFWLQFAIPGSIMFKGLSLTGLGAKAVRALTTLGSAIPATIAEADKRYSENITPEYGWKQTSLDGEPEFGMVAAPDAPGEAAYKAIGGAAFDTGVEVGLEAATMGLLRLAGKPAGWLLGKATPGTVKEWGAKKFNRFMASETGQALRQINRAYQDFTLTTGVNNPLWEQGEENVQAFEKVLNLDGKTSEYKGLQKEWNEFYDRQFNADTQWDIFYGLIAQLGLGAAKSTAEGVARHVSEADVRRDVRMALARSGISEATLKTLTPEQQKKLDDMWRQYSADPGKLKAEVKDLGISMRLAVDELTAREGLKMRQTLEQRGIAPERFTIQTGADGKPAFQKMTRFTPDGKKAPMNAMTDAAHGVTIVDQGDGNFYVMNDFRGLDAIPASSFEDAQKKADAEVVRNQSMDADNEQKAQYLMGLVQRQYAGRNVVSIPSEAALRWQVAQAVRDGRPLYGITRADQLFWEDGSLRQPGAGGFHTPDGHIVVILDNVPSPAEMERALAHEATGHEGVESATGHGAKTVEFIQNAQAEGFSRFVEGERQRRIAANMEAGMDEESAVAEAEAHMATDDYKRESMARYAQGRLHAPTWYERRKHEANERRRAAGENVPTDQADLEVMLAEQEAQGRAGDNELETLPGDSGVRYEEGATDEARNGTDEAQSQPEPGAAEPAGAEAPRPAETGEAGTETPREGVVETSSNTDAIGRAERESAKKVTLSNDALSDIKNWIAKNPNGNFTQNGIQGVFDAEMERVKAENGGKVDPRSVMPTLDAISLAYKEMKARGSQPAPSAQKQTIGGQNLTGEASSVPPDSSGGNAARGPKNGRGDNLRAYSYEKYAASPDEGGTADEMGAELMRFARDNGGLLKMPPNGVADPMADWINSFLDGGARKKNRGEFIALFGMKPKTGSNDAIAEDMPTGLKDYVEKMIERDGPGAVADWFLETRRKYREWAQGRRDAAREERLAAKDRVEEVEALESFDFDELAAARDAMDEEFANALGVVEGADEADYAALTPASLQIAKSGDTIRFDHDRKSFVFGSFDAESGVLVVYDEDAAGMEGGKFRRAYRVTENSIEEIDDGQGNEVRADADRAGDEKGPAGGGGEAQGGGFRLESVTAGQITAENKKRAEKEAIKKRQEAPLKGSGQIHVQPEMDLGQVGQQDLFSPIAEKPKTAPASAPRAEGTTTPPKSADAPQGGKSPLVSEKAKGNGIPTPPPQYKAGDNTPSAARREENRNRLLSDFKRLGKRYLTDDEMKTVVDILKHPDAALDSVRTPATFAQFLDEILRPDGSTKFLLKQHNDKLIDRALYLFNLDYATPSAHISDYDELFASLRVNQSPASAPQGGGSAEKSLVWDSVTPERSKFMSGAITDPAHIKAIHELDREHDILEVVDPPNVNSFGTMYVDVIERKGGRVVASRYYVDSSYKGDVYHPVARGLQGGELSETKLQDWHFDTLRGRRDEWLKNEEQDATAPTKPAPKSSAPTASRTTAKPAFKRGDRVFLKGAKDGQRVTFLKANADGTADVQVRTPGANRYAPEKVETRIVPMGEISSTGMKDTLTDAERNAYRRGVAEQTREAMRSDPALQRIDAAYRAAKTDAERNALKAQFAERVRALQGGVNFDTPGIYTGTAADYANRSRQGGMDDGPSLKKIGTGEGSQVYGWGLYGSSVRGVAEGYARGDVFAKKNPRRAGHFEINGKRLPEWVSDRILEFDEFGSTYFDGRKPDAEFLIEALKDKGVTYGHEDAGRILKQVEENRDGLRFVSETDGNVYEQTFFTNRAPGDESHLLKWYEPISEEQLGWIESRLKAEGIGNVNMPFLKGELPSPDNPSGGPANAKIKNGRTVYDHLANKLGSPKAASEFLARAGIDGVKYPVDSYGGKGVKDGDEAGWNYVSFRDDNIRVDHKWTDGVLQFDTPELSPVTPAEDAAYMDAVRRGDMETAQEAVNKRVRELGGVFHRGKAPDATQYIVEFADDPTEIESYGEHQYALLPNQLTDVPDFVKDFALEYFAEDNGVSVDELSEEKKEKYRDSVLPSKIRDWADAWDRADFVSALWEKYSSEFEEMIDNGIVGFKTPDGAVAWPQEKAAYKIADPVTYDDAGNVIPLSQRFNPQNGDIRFDTPELTPADSEEYARFKRRVDTTLPWTADETESAIGIYGVSDDVPASGSGFILPDGRFLPGGTAEHQELAGAFSSARYAQDDWTGFDEGEAYGDEFEAVRAGLIRFGNLGTGLYVDVYKKPTDAQIASLGKLARSDKVGADKGMKEELRVDFGGGRGATYANVGSLAKRLVSDVRRNFDGSFDDSADHRAVQMFHVSFDTPELTPAGEDGVNFDTKNISQAESYEASEKRPIEDDQLIGFTKEDVAHSRRVLGMVPLTHTARTDAERHMMADALLSRSGYGQKLAHAVANFGRPLFDYEQTALGKYRVQRLVAVNEAKLVADAMQTAYDVLPKDAPAAESQKALADLKAAKAELQTAMGLLDVADRADDKAGTEWGRSGRARQDTVKLPDFSYAGITRGVAQTFGGSEKIPQELMPMIENAAKEFEKADEMQKKIVAAQFEKALDKAFSAAKNGAKIRRAVEHREGDEAKRAEKNYLEALAQFQIGAEETGGTLIGLADQKAPGWGKWLRYLAEYHCFMNPDIKVDECVAKMMEDLKECGMTAVDEVQVWEAWTGYGHSFRQSRFESQRRANWLKSQALHKKQLQHMNETNTLPEATGLIRDEDPTPEGRELRKEVYDRKKEVPDAERDERHLKGILDTIRRRLENDIADLERAIATGEQIPPRNRTVREDIDIREKRKRKAELREVYDKMFGTKHTLTPEQKIAIAEKAMSRILERDLEDIARAEQGDFSKIEGHPTVNDRYVRTLETNLGKKRKTDSPTLQAMREKHLENVKQMLALKKAKFEYGMTPEEIAAHNAKKLANLDKRIAHYAEIFTTGDLRRNVSRQPPMTPEQQKQFDEKEEQLKKAQRKLAELRLEALRATAPKWARNIKEYGAFILAAQRALKTTIDFSSMFNQAAGMTIAHPLKAIRSFGKAWSAMWSDARMATVNDEIMSDPQIQEAVKKYGLHLREVDADNGRDVDMFKGMESQTVKLFGKRVAISDIPLYGKLMLASERHYITYLNAMSAELYVHIANGLNERFPGGMTPWMKKQLCDMINIWNGSGALTKEKRRAWQEGGISNFFFSLPLLTSQVQTIFWRDALRPLSQEGLKNEEGVAVPVTDAERKTMAKIGAFEHVKMAVATLALSALLRWIFADDDDRWQFDGANWFEKLIMAANPKVGNTTLDFTGGTTTTYRLLYKLASGFFTGKVKTGSGRSVKYGGSFGTDASRLVSRFLEGRLAPWLSTALSILNKKNFVGEQYGAWEAAKDMFVPMSLEDSYEQIDQNGFAPSLFTIPLTIAGVRAQTYDRKPYENAVNTFLEAEREYGDYATDGNLGEADRKAVLDEMKASNPLLADGVRDILIVRRKGGNKGLIPNAQKAERNLKKLKESPNASKSAIAEAERLYHKTREDVMKFIRENRRKKPSGSSSGR